MSELMLLDHNANETVSRPGFRAGTDEPDLSVYESPFTIDHDVDLQAVRTFIEEAMQRFPKETTNSDVWLAPRLHYALRLTRREAANRGLWRWLGCVFAPDYVRARWGPADGADEDDAAKTERFVGSEIKHALGRLWWMAELFRDGSDYRPVCLALANQDIPNNLFRMDIAHHRPSVLAAVRVLDGRTGRDANALAKALNSAATTLVVDAIAPDESLDAEAARAWVNGEPPIDPNRYLDELPPGPADPPAPAESIERMESLLEELFAEAPVRGREPVEAG